MLSKPLLCFIKGTSHPNESGHALALENKIKNKKNKSNHTNYSLNKKLSVLVGLTNRIQVFKKTAILYIIKN